MTTYSLADLLAPETAEDALDALLTDLSTQGFPTTAWDDFEPIVGILRADARALSDLLQLVSIVARAGLVELSPGTAPGSPGDWLSLLAGNYGLRRFSSTTARLKAQVRLSPVASPLTLAPAGLTIEYATGSARLRYNLATTAVLNIAPGMVTEQEFVAEFAGKQFNRTLADLVDPVQSIPGLTVALVPASVGATTPMVEAGVDEETDASLRARMRTRWDTIGLQKTTAAYEFLARNTPDVVTPITRIRIDASNPRGPNTVDIYIATDAGPALAGDVTAVHDYIRHRSAIGSDVLVLAAVAEPLAIAATVRAPGMDATALKAQLQNKIDDFILSIPLGGTLIISQLVDTIQDESLGITSVDINSITVNGILRSSDFAIGGPSSVAIPAIHFFTVQT